MPSLTRGTLAKIESGVRKSVTAEELVALAHALGVPVSDLLPSEDPVSPVAASTGPARTRTPVDAQQEAAAGDAQPGPYFFLSYAHGPRGDPSGPDPDVWVAQLFDDLCEHIKSLADLPPGRKAGFMDRELRQGHEWPRRLTHALGTCRVFVPLYSRRYFKSEHCGKEWSAFKRRALYHAARNDGRVEMIVPALWIPVRDDELPEAASSVQFQSRDFSPLYAEHGFYGIMKVSRWREAYEEAVYLLARQILDAAESSHIEPEILSLDYESLESAFGPSGDRTGGDHPLRPW
jgi:hypothetical protein